jgi:hypothetical protein
MSIKRIAQPYVVFWKHDERQEGVLRDWCLNNLVNPYVVFATESPNSFLVDLSALVHEKMGPTSVFMFDCPRDAMLFKLTWGG